MKSFKMSGPCLKVEKALEHEGTVIPIVIGARGIVTKNLGNRLG